MSRTNSGSLVLLTLAVKSGLTAALVDRLASEAAQEVVEGMRGEYWVNDHGALLRVDLGQTTNGTLKRGGGVRGAHRHKDSRTHTRRKE